MSNKALVRLPVISLILLLAASSLAAQGNKGGAAQRGGNQIIPVPPVLQTVEGTASAVAFEYGAGHPNFTLESNGTSYEIYVGPLRYIDVSNFELSVGDRVIAAIFQDPQSSNAWVAAVLTNVTTEQSITLRDAAGAPLWIRNRRNHSAGNGTATMLSQGPSTLRAGSPSIDLATLTTYTGTVTKVNIAPGLQNPTIEVSLSGDKAATAVFCLAPYRYLSQIGFSVTANDVVTITAADCLQKLDEFAVFQITTPAGSFTLRNPEGTPAWFFGR